MTADRDRTDNGQRTTDNGQRTIEGLLARRIGLDPVSTGPHVILGAVRRRMAELGVSDLEDYAARAADSETEQQALIEEVVVPESWFFRDERPFRLLADRAHRNWVSAPWRGPLRALSVPCAGGQEPYSMAIALLDAGLRARRFHIDAVDVSARVLEIARLGVYSPNAIRGEGRWTRHFRRLPRGFEIDPTIRAAVRFLPGNLLDPKLLTDAPPYDVVFCRNLLIYMEPAARSRALAALDRLLADDGLLFIGHADRLDEPGRPPRFAKIDEPGCFAYRKARPTVPLALPRPVPPPMLPRPESLRMLPKPRPSPSPPPMPPTTPVPPGPPPAPSLLEQAAELANRGHYDEAIAACERHIRNKGPGAEAYYLMGMIRQASGDRRRAEECFHKTIYLDPRHDEALLALALLAERRGDTAAADGFRRRASRRNPESHVET